MNGKRKERQKCWRNEGKKKIIKETKRVDRKKKGRKER